VLQVEALGKPHIVLTAGGFLVPGDATGSIDLFDAADPARPLHAKVSTDKKNWFYHKAVWADIDGDGRLDILAARATVKVSATVKVESGP
jgi:hypothetical protein